MTRATDMGTWDGRGCEKPCSGKCGACGICLPQHLPFPASSPDLGAGGTSWAGLQPAQAGARSVIVLNKVTSPRARKLQNGGGGRGPERPREGASHPQTEELETTLTAIQGPSGGCTGNGNRAGMRSAGPHPTSTTSTPPSPSCPRCGKAPTESDQPGVAQLPQHPWGC